ncbi:hypothetical protein ACWEKT_37460 [Nocardia takedensis]
MALAFTITTVVVAALGFAYAVLSTGAPPTVAVIATLALVAGIIRLMTPSRSEDTGRADRLPLRLLRALMEEHGRNNGGNP